MIRKAFLVLAIMVAVHGLLFGATAALAAWRGWSGAPEAIQYLFFFALVVPALILTAPLDPLLWALHLMNAPGWFAWPKPLGFALGYAAWVLVLVAAAYVAGACARLRSRV